MEGSVLKYNKEGGLLTNLRGKGGGLGQICPSSSSFLPNRAEEGDQRRRRPWARGLGARRRPEWRGERGSGVRGFNSPAHLGMGRGEEAGQREQAAKALGSSGGGARELGENRHGVV